MSGNGGGAGAVRWRGALAAFHPLKTRNHGGLVRKRVCAIIYCGRLARQAAIGRKLLVNSGREKWRRK